MDCESLEDNLNTLIINIKNLGYEFESWESDYIKLCLMTPCLSRARFLCWILNIFGFLYTYEEIRNFNQSLTARILNDLAALGLVTLQDQDLVSGNANFGDQLKFWKKLTHMCLRYKDIPMSNDVDACSDVVLHSLVNSPIYKECLQVDDLSLLSEDLKQKYKRSNKVVDLSEALEDLTSKRDQLVSSELTAYDGDSDVKALVESISRLSASTANLLTTYETNLKPWCKNPLPENNYSSTGELVSTCSEEMEKLFKSIELAKSEGSKIREVKDSTEELKNTKNSDIALDLIESVMQDL